MRVVVRVTATRLLQRLLMQRARLANAFWVLGSTIFCFAFAIVLLSTASFAIGYPITPIVFWFGCCASILFCGIAARTLSPKLSLAQTAGLILLFILIFAVSIALSASFYDQTYDGQIYHQYAVDQLSLGWNPWRDKIDNIWGDSYPKAPWIDAAAINQITHTIEAGKAFNWALMVGALSLSIGGLLTCSTISILDTLGLSVVAAFNPVAIDQSLSFYVDGQLSSLLLALVATLGVLGADKQNQIRTSPTLVFVIVLLSNIKFTGLIYAVLITLLFGMSLFFLSRRKETIRFGGIASLTLIFSVFVVGYNPYVTNTLTHGHPFYPLAGQAAIDIITPQQPIPLFGKNHIQQLLISIFSRPGNYHPVQYHSHTLDLQIPFFLDETSVSVFQFPDGRIGGFGPLFNVLFVLGMLLTMLLLALRTSPKRGFILSILILWVTVLINPAPWWARYVPQLWLFPLLAAFFALQNISNRSVSMLARSILLIGCVNVLIIGKVYITYNLKTSHAIQDFMTQIRHDRPSLLLLKQDSFGWYAPLVRLREQGIHYQVIDSALPCANPGLIPYSGITYCSSFEERQPAR